jgi:2,4-dienoyl-CoA reductase-like NADH-dependent reductase (Old Yellow Enzyme family)
MEESLAPFGGSSEPTKLHNQLYSLWAKGHWGLIITGLSPVQAAVLLPRIKSQLTMSQHHLRKRTSQRTR